MTLRCQGSALGHDVATWVALMPSGVGNQRHLGLGRCGTPYQHDRNSGTVQHGSDRLVASQKLPGNITNLSCTENGRFVSERATTAAKNPTTIRSIPMGGPSLPAELRSGRMGPHDPTKYRLFLRLLRCPGTVGEIRCADAGFSTWNFARLSSRTDRVRCHFPLQTSNLTQTPPFQ